MYGTHCKHCSLIPPLVSNNNLALLRCGYMYPRTLVHISRHLGKTSNNNNKRCQLHIVLWFAEYASIGFHFRFSILWSLLYYGCLYPALSLVFYFTSLLLLSYHTISFSYLISLAICLPASVCLCSRHGFKCMFMIHIYWYTCAYLCTPLGIRITTRRGVLTPLDSHVQVSKLGLKGDLLAED